MEWIKFNKVLLYKPFKLDVTAMNIFKFEGARTPSIAKTTLPVNRILPIVVEPSIAVGTATVYSDGDAIYGDVSIDPKYSTGTLHIEIEFAIGGDSMRLEGLRVSSEPSLDLDIKPLADYDTRI